MSKKITILKNSGALGISTVIGKLFYFILFLCIGRSLGPEELGKFAFAVSFIALFCAGNDLGLSIRSVKEVSQNKGLAEKFLSNLVTMKLVLGCLTLALVIAVATILGYSQESVRLVFLIGLSTLFIVISQGMRWYFQAIQKLEYESLIFISQNFLYLILGYLAIKLGLGIRGVAYTQVLVGVLVLALTWIIVRNKLIPFNFKFDFAFWRQQLKSSIPLGLMLIFTGIYLNSDTVILSVFKGDKAVGFYNAANRIAGAAKMLPIVIIPSIFPVMSEITDWSKFRKLMEKAVHYSLALALPFGLMVAILSKKIMLTFYGEEFLASTLPLQILIWSTVLVFFNSLFGYALIAKGQQKANTMVVGTGVLVSLVLNFLLAPQFSYVGTSSSIFCTELFVFSGAYFLAHRRLGINLWPMRKQLLKIMLCAFAMGIGVYLMQLWNIGLPAIILLGGLIYIFLIMRTDAILAQDWTDFKHGFTGSSFAQRRLLPLVGSLLRGVKR